VLAAWVEQGPGPTRFGQVEGIPLLGVVVDRDVQIPASA